MAGRATALSLLGGTAILGAAALGVLGFRGDAPGAVAGVLLGVGLGAAGSVLEMVLVSAALRQRRPAALRIVLAGFGLRLVALLAITLAAHRSGFADPVSFALCFLAGFLAAVPFLAVVSFRAAPVSPAGGGA
jgi:hypothetical protein